MYNKIRRDIQGEYYQKNYPNDGQRFVAWYLMNVHNLDEVEVKDCVTDGAGDKQIDAIYVDNEDNIVYLIQGKFYGGDTVDAEPLREVLSAWHFIKDLRKLQDGANHKLQIKIEEMARALEDGYDICFELIVTSSLTSAANECLDVFRQELAQDDRLAANLSVVDIESLKFKYEEALNVYKPYVNHTFSIEKDKYIELSIDDTKAIIFALPLKECVYIPGIKDGSLFRKNVRQSLGNGNKVNKGIAATIKNNPAELFFLHNGITAICSRFCIDGNQLFVKDLNVVNGCQSLTTIYCTSEYAKRASEAYVLCRLYQIEDGEKADKISVSTNSQSAVKARDLRSNDKYVLAMKKRFEQYYTDGYFVTKRGEHVNIAKYNSNHIVNLTDLGKELMAWHSQRPTISYSETKIFDKYFEQLFCHEYEPECILALHMMFGYIMERWNKDNDLGLNETILSMKAYAPYHLLYTLSYIVTYINGMSDLVPDPSVVYRKLRDNDLLSFVVDLAGKCLNASLESAKNDVVESGKIFVPQNWIKSKTSLKDIRKSVGIIISVYSITAEGKLLVQKMNNALKMEKENFDSRWTAD